jgi:PAS domain S-box
VDAFNDTGPFPFPDRPSPDESEGDVVVRERRYRSLVDAYAATTWAMDASGRVVEDSVSWRQLTGQTAEAMRGWGWLDVVHPEDRQRVQRLRQWSLESRSAFQAEFRIRTVAGEYRTVAARVVPINAPDGGGVLEWFGSLEDVTARRRADEILRQSADRLDVIARITRSVVASVPIAEQVAAIAEQTRDAFKVDACVIRSLEGDQLKLLGSVGVPDDQLFATLPARYGIAEDIITSRHTLSLNDVPTHPVTAARNQVAGFKFLSYAGAPLMVEDRVVGILGIYTVREHRHFSATDLEHLQMVANYAAVTLENDRLYRNIQEQKELVEERIQERERAEAALRASETRFKAIFENSFDAIGVLSEGRHIYCNPAYLRLFGYSRQEELTPVPFLDLIPPAYRDRTVQQRVQQQEGVEQSAVFETRGLRSDGREFPMEAHESNYTLDGVTYTVSILRDITERKAAEEAQNQLLYHQQRIAQTLQRSLLLAPKEDAFPNIRVKALYEPASDEADVGGDFFDVFPLSGGKVALVVGDVVGKGLAAASYTAQTKFALRALLREYPDPAVAMGRLNGFLLEMVPTSDVPSNPLVALSLAVADTATGELEITTAGAEQPLIVRTGGAVEQIQVGGMILSAEESATFHSDRVTLEKGDLLMMLTDGIAEARRGRTLFADEGLPRAAREALQFASLESMGQHIITEAQEFAGGRLRDDACLLILKRI